MKLNLKEQLRMLALMLALPMVFVACSDDDDNDPTGGAPIVAQKGVFVFDSGNQGKNIDGALSFIDEKTNTATNDVFRTVNARSLGSTVQDGVILGQNLYIAVSESNTIEVVDKNTLVSVTQIAPTAEQGSKPRDIVTDGKYVYVSMYSGHVSRIDASKNVIDKTVKVGPNPEEMAVANGCLYVVNSDGLNWEAGYVNGKSVSKIDLASFAETKIPVGLNPTKIVADASGNLLVICMGNYSDVPASIWKISSSDAVEDWGKPATIMAVKGNSLYTVYDSYAGADAVEYTVYNTLTGSVEKDNFVASPVDSPSGIAVDPDNGNIFITSYTLVGGFASYTTPGYVNEYSADGTFVKKYDVGVGAVCMTFLK